MIAFGQPLALLALLALLPVAVASGYAAARRRAADAAMGGAGRGGDWRRWARSALLLTAVALLALAAARPQWGEAEQPLARRGIDLAIVLDVSRSMTGDDVKPTRAEAAAARLTDMLEHLPGDRVGLVTFGDSAFVRSPLTLDFGALSQLLARAQQEAPLVRPGSNLGGAIGTALELLDVEDAATAQAILLVSDGEDLAGRSLDHAVERARERGIRVYTAAAGTEAGAPIAVDDAGSVEVSRLDRALLAGIAAETGGELRDLDAIAGLAVEFARLRQTVFDTDERSAPVDRFQWFLGAALMLLLAQPLVREGRGRVALRLRAIGLGAAALVAVAAFAACGGTEVYQLVSQGNAEYRAGRHEDALASYRRAAELAPEDAAIAYNIGNALHRLDRFEEAAAASSAAAAGTDDVRVLLDATYALGSHAFRRGALEEAREALIAVLRRDPDDEDARHNLEVVLTALAAARPPEAGGDGEQDSESPAGEGDNEGAGGQEGTPAGAPGAAGSPSPTPGAGDGPEPQGRPGAAGDGGDGTEAGTPADAQTLEEAQGALRQVLLAAGEEVTAEEALAILDLVRRVNALESLDRSAQPGGRLPAR